MQETGTWEVHAVRYAHHERRASANFLGGDPHDGPMPIDYFVWAIVGDGRSFVVDTGFDAAEAAKRQRELIRSPAEGLAAIGVDSATVEDVIVTHLHYDHAGNHDMFPAARFHLQDREMGYATGRCMCHATMRDAFAVEDVVRMVRRVYEGKVAFHDGADEIAPGITLHPMPGHTMGLQAVRVRTRRGWVVLASDATHLYANMEEGRPYPIVWNVAEMMESHRALLRLASSPRHVIPGHDPLVLRRFPASRPALEGIAVRLDAEPVRW